MAKNGYDQQIFTRMTRHQVELLEQLRVKKKFPHRSDVVRDAVEQYIQNEGNVIGSRRHFNQTMRSLLNEIREIIIITFTWQLVLIAQGFSSLLKAITKEEDNDNWHPMTFINESGKVAQKQYPLIRANIEQIQEAQRQEED